jgi:hypothetical protein
MGRLIDGGPDVVLLYPEVEDEDSDGNPERRPSPTPITIRCQLHRVSAEESATLGQTSTATYYFNTSRDLPLGAFAGAKVRGRDAMVVGEPTRQGRSGRTAHTRVVVRILEPKV